MFQARYADDPQDQVRDITHMAAELLLLGALDAAEAQQAGRPAPTDEVTIGTVSYTEQALPGQVRGVASFTWMHLPTQTSEDFDPREVLALLVRGMTVAITEGVAKEATDGQVPADASAVDTPPPVGAPASTDDPSDEPDPQ